MSEKPVVDRKAPRVRRRDKQPEELVASLAAESEKDGAALLDGIAESGRFGSGSERKQQRYALALQAASAGCWDWDIRSGAWQWSEEAEPTFGFAHGELGQTHEAFLEHVHPDDRQDVIDAVNACLKQGERYALNHRIVRPDGEVIRVLATGDVIRDGAGKPIRMLGVIQDITTRREGWEEHRRLAEELRERIKELNCLFGISSLAGRKGYTLEEILLGTVELIPPAWQFPEIAGARILLNGQEYKTEEFQETPWRQASQIFVHGQPAGRVEVCYNQGKPEKDEGPFLEEERSLLNAIAERLGRIAERLAGEEELRASRQFLRSALDALSANIAILDEAGTILAVNESWRVFVRENDLLGADQGVGRNYLSVLSSVSGMSGAMVQEAATSLQELIVGQRDHFSQEFASHAPGDERWFVMRATRFQTGTSIRVLTSHENITKQRLAEQLLQKSKDEAEVARRQEEERRREAEQRRRIAESLGDVLAALNSDQPLDKVLDLITIQARRLLDTRAVGLYRLEDEVGTLSVQAAQGLLVTYVAGANIPFGRGALRRAMVTQEPVAVADVSAHLSGDSDLVLDARHRARAGHWTSIYKGLLAVPICAQDQVYGGMLLYYGETLGISSEDIELAALFGDQAALAIENARLRDQVKQAAATAERNRLARELHDAVTQTLFSASLIAEALPRVWERDPEEGRRGLGELGELTRGASAEMRTLLLELRPAALTEKPLGELLRHLTAAMTSRTRLPIDLTVQGQGSIPPNLQIALYRIAQEALNNMAKHAGASRATLQLTYSRPQITLSVRDDGRGFAASDILPDRLGVSIMHERADRAGASLQINSQPGQGTEVLVTWPDSGEW